MILEYIQMKYMNMKEEQQYIQVDQQHGQEK